MENPIAKIVRNRKGLKKIRETLVSAQQIGIDLKGLVSELDLKEQQLVTSEKKYRAFARLTESVVDNVPGYLWAKDHKHRYLFSNKLLRDLYRIECKEDMLGKTDEDLIIEAIFAGCRIDLTHINHQKISAHDSTEVFIKSGYLNDVPFSWEVHRAPLVNDKGKTIGTVCVARDITDTYTQEEEII